MISLRVMKINVGDEVQVWQGVTGWSKDTYKVLHIHKLTEVFGRRLSLEMDLDPDHLWVLVDFSGDVPRSYPLRDVRLVSKGFCLQGKYYEVFFVDGKPDWNSVKEVV